MAIRASGGAKNKNKIKIKCIKIKTKWSYSLLLTPLQHNYLQQNWAKCPVFSYSLFNSLAQFTSSIWIVVGNGEEAENIGSLVSLTIFQFQFVKLQIREREGKEKMHSHNSETGRKWKETHFPNSGMGKEWKKAFPKSGNGNQTLSFLGMDGNGNSCSPLTPNQTLNT